MNKLLLFFSVCGLLITNNVFAQDEATKQSVALNIKWVFEIAGDAPPAKLSVWAYPVPIGIDGSVKGVRGNVGALSCGNIAVLYALGGNRQAGFEWLKAAQAHNPDVIALFNAYPDYTIDYATQTYRNSALQAGSLGSGVVQIKQLGGIFGGVFNGSYKATNPPAPEYNPKQSIPGDRPGRNH